MMKTRYDNDVIDHIDVVFAKNETELPWSIGSSPVFDEN